MENSGNDSSTNDNIDTVPCISNMNVEISPPFQVILSDDPIDNAFDIKVDIKDAHITLGLELTMDTTTGQIELISCRTGTPAKKMEIYYQAWLRFKIQRN